MKSASPIPQFISGAVKEGYAVVHEGLVTYADSTPIQPHRNLCGADMTDKNRGSPVRSSSCLYPSRRRPINSLRRSFTRACFWDGRRSRYVPGNGRYSLTAGHKMGEVCPVRPTLENIYSGPSKFGPDRVIDPSRDYAKLTRARRRRACIHVLPHKLLLCNQSNGCLPLIYAEVALRKIRLHS